MRTRNLLAATILAAAPVIGYAQAPVEAKPINADECTTYVSLFHESAKNKQYADAFESWLSVWTTCPSASQNIYVDGDKIVEWKLSQCQPGSEEYKAWRNVLLKLHDDRIQYFGTSKKYPAVYVLGEKGVDYCTFFTEDATKATAYPWLKESITGLGAQSKLTVLNKFAEVTLGLYKSNPTQYAEQYIADYQICSDLYSQMAADPANKNAAAAAAQKDYNDQLFAASGAADCSKLDELYAGTVNSNKENLELLGKVMALYRRVGCVESDVYFAAAEASHKLAPTSESAAGCAAMCKKKADWKGAVEYYDQATDLAETDEDKAEYQYRAASVIYSEMKNYSLTRQYLRRSLEFNPNQGRCYILMGILYANSQPYSRDDFGAKAAILNKTVYWAAVDKFVKARQVDATCAEEASKLISTYSKYFPSKEERFDLPGEFSGSTFTVGGWIGETTSIR